MSKLSFTVHCIEMYANHTNHDGDEIYSIFKDSGILELLDTDYEDLHGMSFEYLMEYFDNYLVPAPYNAEKKQAYHTLYNALVVTEIVKQISDEFYLSEAEALDTYYSSVTAKCLYDPETRLYGQGALYISHCVLTK